MLPKRYVERREMEVPATMMTEAPAVFNRALPDETTMFAYTCSSVKGRQKGSAAPIAGIDGILGKRKRAFVEREWECLDERAELGDRGGRPSEAPVPVPGVCFCTLVPCSAALSGGTCRRYQRADLKDSMMLG